MCEEYQAFAKWREEVNLRRQKEGAIISRRKRGKKS